MLAKSLFLHPVTVHQAITMLASPGARHALSVTIQTSLRVQDKIANTARQDRRRAKALVSWCRITKLRMFQEIGLLYDVHAVAQNHA